MYIGYSVYVIMKTFYNGPDELRFRGLDLIFTPSVSYVSKKKIKTRTKIAKQRTDKKCGGVAANDASLRYTHIANGHGVN